VFFSTSETALQTQGWNAVCTDLLTAITQTRQIWISNPISFRFSQERGNSTDANLKNKKTARRRLLLIE
jgi:hypothetical protein